MNVNRAIEQRFGLPTTIGRTVESNSTIDCLLSRKSVREFTPELVDVDLMKSLLAAAMSAPSKSDLQQARVVWVKDADVKQKIADLSPNLQGWVAKAPEFLVWCGDCTLSHQLAESHGHPYANDHLDQFMNPSVDTGIAMAFFMCAAESTGLGCCPVSSIRDTPGEVAALLKLPKFVFPVAGMVVGYPSAENPSVHSMRLPLSVTVMENEYRQDTERLLQEVEAYSERRERLRPTPPSAQRAVEIFGIAEKYGWSEDKTRQYSQPARTDWGAFIRRQGFSLG